MVLLSQTSLCLHRQTITSKNQQTPFMYSACVITSYSVKHHPVLEQGQMIGRLVMALLDT